MGEEEGVWRALETGSNHVEDWGTRTVTTLVGVRCCLFATDHVSSDLVDVYLVCRSHREGSYVVRCPC